MQWTNPDLVFTFTMPEVGPPRIITFIPSSTIDSTLGVLISGPGNTSRCSGSPSYQMTAAGGSYRFQVFSNGVWSAQNGAPSLPPFSVTAYVEGVPGNFPFTTKTAGFIRKDQTPNSSAINSAFTQGFGDIIDSAGATINFAMTSWNFNGEPPAPPSIHFDGAVSAAGNAASASGSWKDGGVTGFGPYSLNANFQYTASSGLQVGYTVRLIRVG